jgi:PAS domain S-box-containing protein
VKPPGFARGASSEEDLRRLFEAAPVPLILTRRTDSTILLLNGVAARTFEVDAAAVAGRPAVDFYVRAEERTRFLEAMARDGSVDRMELELKTASGRHLWTSVSASVIQFHGEPVVMVGVTDLTDRDLALRALRESEERFRALAEDSPVGVYQQDLEGNCVYSNARWSEITGLRPDEAWGRGWERAIHPDDLVPAAEAWLLAIQRGERYVHEMRFVRPDGSVRWVSAQAGQVHDADGNVVGYVGTLEDITERRRSEEVRREESDFRSSIIESAAEGLCVSHAIDQFPYVAFTVWNKRMDEITGYTLAEINERGWYQMLYPDAEVQARAQARMARMRVGDNLRAEPWEIARKDGQKRTVQITTSLLQSTDGQGHVLALIDDVTERHQAEAARRESEKMLRLVLDTIPVRVFWKDRDLRYLGCNRMVAADSGLDSPEQVVGRTDYDFSWAAQAKTYQADDRQVMASGRPKLNYEEPLSTHDGHVIWARTSKFPLRDEQGEVVGILGTFEDVTERKEVEEGRRLLAERLALATQAAAIGVWELDLASQMLHVDDQFVALYGGVGDAWEPGELWTDRLHTDDRAASLARRRAALSQESSIYDDEVRVIWPDGSLHHVKNLGRLVRDAFGRPLRLVGVSMDITAAKTAEAGIRQLNAELERRVEERTSQLIDANRELESFSYSVSHDLRAPLRAIDGFSQALNEDFGDKMDDAARGHLQRVRQASQRMGQLIDDLLNLSRTSRTELRRRQVALSPMAEQVLAQLRVAHPEREVTEVVAPDLYAEADDTLTRLLLENLIGNAWKYTSKKPKARIEVGQGPGRGVFFVRDDGVGFDPAFAHKLFGPFQRLHGVEEFEGTGIGLATVHRIVTRHGGRVWGEAEPGRGATFYFSLGPENAR